MWYVSWYLNYNISYINILRIYKNIYIKILRIYKNIYINILRIYKNIYISILRIYKNIYINILRIYKKGRVKLCCKIFWKIPKNFLKSLVKLSLELNPGFGFPGLFSATFSDFTVQSWAGQISVNDTDVFKNKRKSPLPNSKTR